MPVYLIEIDGYGLSLQTFRFATEAYITSPSDSPANTVYEPRIVDPGTFNINLFSAGETSGSAMTANGASASLGSGSGDIGYGDVIIANADGALDSWFDLGFDGRRVEIKSLASAKSAFSSAVTVFKGRVERIDTADAWQTLRVRMFDRRLDLDLPLQTTRYGGTVTGSADSADGTVDLKDQVKPLAFGRVYNIKALPVNPFDGIYQVSDGAVASIQAYDGGVPLDLASNYGSIAALRAATVIPGQFATALSLGLFRIAATSFQCTADVVEGSTRSAGQVAKRMMQKFGLVSGVDFDDSSITALDGLNSAEVGVWLDSEINALAAIQQVLGSIGAWIAPNSLGMLVVGRFSAPGTPSDTLTLDDMLEKNRMKFEVTQDAGRGIPAYRVIINYKRNYFVMQGSEVHGCVDDDTRAYLLTEWRQAKCEDVSINTKFKLAVELTMDTYLTQLSDALSEGARLLSLYGARRDRVNVMLWMDRATSINLGDTVSIRVPRFGYDSGRPMRVIGRTDSRVDNTVLVDLYG